MRKVLLFLVAVSLVSFPVSCGKSNNSSGENHKEKENGEEHHENGEGDHKEGSHEEQSGHSHNKAKKHGGTVTMTDTHHFEVVFEGEALQVHGYDDDQNPISLKGASGSVTVKTKGGESKTLNLEYHSGDSKYGYLEAHSHHLKELKPGRAKLTFDLKNLSKGASLDSFTVPYEGDSGKGHKKEEDDHHEDEGHHHEEGEGH